MSTSKSKRLERKRRKKQTIKRRKFTHTVIQGNVRYNHIGAEIKSVLVNPLRITFLIKESACGRCPLSLICLGNRSWTSLLMEYTFFCCMRCCAFGFIDKRIGAGMVHENPHLYVCFLLRNGRADLPWRNTLEQRHYGHHQLQQNIVTNDVRFQCLGDLPFACVTRCRDALGQITKEFSDSVDCRTTIHNAAQGAITRY